jgi:hypothetical protein
MKIQLILENQEVELTNDVNIPLTKTFENLENPTDIITDYSKSINIPMTSRNNEILSNSYRLDRTIVSNNSNSNIGIYLDPTKRIPMKLLYNSNVILDGYAKFVSSNNSTKNSYYTLKLFGVLGDIFQKLKSVVLSEDLLSEEQRLEEDGGQKYILEDPCDYSPRIVNSDYIAYCWSNVHPDPLYTNEQTSIIGFAPSYRGYYNEFNSSQIQIAESTEDGSFIGLDQYLNEYWKATYKRQNPNKTDEEVQAYVDSLGSGDAIGDGLKDYQMGEYRSYMFKPYIYFNKLLQIYQRQLTKLSDYTLELDENWFNINNPYWTRLCYMLDYLDGRDGNKDVDEQITNEATNKYNYDTSYFYRSVPSSIVGNTYIDRSNNFLLRKNEIKTRLEGVVPSTYANSNPDVNFEFQVSTYFQVQVRVINNASRETVIKTFYVSPYNFEDVKQIIHSVTEDNFIKMSSSKTTKKVYVTSQGTTVTYGRDYTIPIPEILVKFNNAMSDGVNITYNIYCYNDRLTNFFAVREKPDFRPDADFIDIPLTIDKITQYSSVTTPPIYIFRPWRSSTPVNIRSIYQKEEPLFDVILQYTKMFGLIWDVDYEEKKIRILHRNTYFKNISIEDWSDRLDRNKDFIIEPITFNNKYISFNYEDTDGYRYTAYKDKYGVNYGEKKIYTGYDFGNETKKLFSGVQPSSTSSKSYISFKTLTNWDLISYFNYTQEPNAIIDCEDEDEKSSISLYNWYLRGDNVTLDTPIIVTDDSTQMKSLGEYCWMDPIIAAENGLTLYSVPTFNIAISSPTLFPELIGKPLSCIFNTPNIDYTNDKLVSNSNGNAIYDLFWKNYINERYNIQNKKVTGYFNLYPEEVSGFNFSKFITLDNQLFMINKIFDYNLNSNTSTKVELIQVTDPQTYSNGTMIFSPFVLSPKEVDIVGKEQPSDRGQLVMVAHINPTEGYVESGSWSQVTGTLVDGNILIFLPEGIADYVFVEPGDWEANLGLNSMVLYWQNMAGKKFNGSVTYTRGNESYKIPITIDYTT